MGNSENQPNMTALSDCSNESLHRLSSALKARRDLALSSVQLLLEGLKNNDPNAIVISLRSLGVNDEDALVLKMSAINAAVHRLIEDFRDALEITSTGGLPRAAARLDEVIRLSFEATDKTLELCEKQAFAVRDHKKIIAELETMLRTTNGSIPEDAFALIEQMKSQAQLMQVSTHNIVMAQSFQDISGQAIRSAIALLKELEQQLIALTLACSDDTEVLSALELVNNRLLLSCDQQEIDSWLEKLNED